MNGSRVDSALSENVVVTTCNNTTHAETETMTSDDAGWVLQCAFMILTMQTGFAMLETGCVSSKNMANIMIKNVCDVSIGGLAYWLFGYGFTFGKPSNPFIGFGDFAFHESNPGIVGSRFCHYFFHFSFASTATTIVSGAVAGRINMKAYMAFSFLNIIIYAIPAHWCWADDGFLKKLGFYDFSGSCVVHLNGGASAFVAAWYVGPRIGFSDHPEGFPINSQSLQMSSPSTAMTGMFILTWANIVFNSASTFGVSGLKWKLGAIVATCTLNGIIGGGISGILLSMLHNKGHMTVDYILLSMMGAMVCVTGSSSVTTTFEATVIGAVGAAAAIYASRLIAKLRIDDPVQAIPVHFFAALWGTLAVGIFGSDNIEGNLLGRNGILHGGNGLLLAANALGSGLMILWSSGLTLAVLVILNQAMGIRMSIEDEEEGADVSEHDVLVSPLQQLEKILEGIDKKELNDFFEAVKCFRSFNPEIKMLIGKIAHEAKNGTIHKGGNDRFNSDGRSQGAGEIEAVTSHGGLEMAQSEGSVKRLSSVIPPSLANGRSASHQPTVAKRSNELICLPNIPAKK